MYFQINDDSPILRIKNINYAVIITTIFFVNCLAGKLFSDMVRILVPILKELNKMCLKNSTHLFHSKYIQISHSMFSLFQEDMFREAVYDIPWYYLSPSSRKFIHLFLTRAHMKIAFKALKVYSMNMVLFLRFYQQVYSVVNVLRQTVKNKN